MWSWDVSFGAEIGKEEDLPVSARGAEGFHREFKSHGEHLGEAFNTAPQSVTNSPLTKPHSN